MLGHLIRKEILDQILSLRFAILAAVGALTIWLSLYGGYTYYRNRLTDYRTAQAATEDRIGQLMVADDWWELGPYGFLEHRPPSPLSIFIRGLEPVLGRSISTNTQLEPRLRQSPAEAEPIIGILPSLDFGTAIRSLWSLLVLLLIYDTVCGEKERGTLRLVTSFPVPGHKLLLGKLLGTLAPVMTAFGLPVLLGVAVLLLMPNVRFTAPEWERLGTVLLASGLYLLAFACAGLLASCLTHHSTTAFVLLLIFWVLNLIVLPGLGLVVAERFWSAPSIHKYQAERKAISQQNLLKWREIRGKAWGDLAEKKGFDWMQTPEGKADYSFYYFQTRRETQLEADIALNRIDRKFRNQYQARLDLAVALARFSPTFALKNSSIRLAGTGIHHYQRFERHFAAYLKQFRNSWVHQSQHRHQLRQWQPEKYGTYEWDISDMPRFTYTERWPVEDLKAAFVDIGLLAVWALVFLAGAFVAMLRYDLR